MRSRAALLPHPADPFLFKYWLKLFTEVWQDEVDKLYILINSPIEFDVVHYMMSLTIGNDKIRCDYITKQIEHGAAIDDLLSVCNEEYVMLIEDDGFIFKKGMVDKCFSDLESGEFDVLGSPRGSCSMEIWEAARDKFQLNYSGVGDMGPNFWPNYLFTKRQHLLNTDRNFGARSWKQGEKIEALDYIVREEVCPSDTFGNTSLQLRAKGLRIKEIPQYHGSPDDAQHFEQKQFLFDGNAPWTHIGSLSSGTHGVLIDDFGRPLARRSIDSPKDEVKVPGQCTTEQEANEWERRVTFWNIFLDNADEGPQISATEAIPEFKQEYEKAINRVITQFNLSPTRISKKKEMYRTLGL